MMTILTNRSRERKPAMTTLDDDGLGIPEMFKVANRTPLTPEQQASAQEVVGDKGAKPVGWDKPKGMNEADWEKAKAEREAEKQAKTVKRISALGESKGLPPIKSAPNPKGSSPVPGKSRKAPQLPLPRKGATLPTPRAPRPAKPLAATRAAPSLKNAPTGPADAAPQTQETTVKKTNAKKKPAAKAKTSGKKAPARAQAAKGAAKAGNGGVRPGSKLELVVGLLKRPQGCTTADVLAATGWPSCSMPQQAKAAGLTLKKEKVKGQNTVYRAA